MTALDSRLPSDLFWQRAVLVALIDLVLVVLLLWRVRPVRFRELPCLLVGSGAVLWGLFSMALLSGYWDTYYRYFYPDSVRWLGAINAALYGAIGFGLWVLAIRLSGNPTITFCLVGGVEGLLEHIWGIYGLGVLQKVPLLQEASALSLLVFSFFEYVLYWGIVLGVAALVQGIWRQWRESRRRQANIA